MTLKRLKRVYLQKRVLAKYITLVEIIFVLASIQLYLPSGHYFLNSTGGSAGINEYSLKISGLNINLSGTAQFSSQHRDIPEFDTVLKPMGRLNRENHILYPEDAQSYILPDNEVIQWYAKNTVLTDDALLWKHNGSPVVFRYEPDDTLFNNPPDGDMWQNPDYYLAHGSVGDCEDFSMAFASILEAKEIPAQVIGVTLINGKNHWIVKYHFNGHINFADINRNDVIIWHDQNPTIYKEWVIIDGEKEY